MSSLYLQIGGQATSIGFTDKELQYIGKRPVVDARIREALGTAEN